MKVNYNATGKERKRLTQTVGNTIGVDAIYKGVPTCAYEINYFTVDREGILILNNITDSHEVEQVFDAIADARFTPQENRSGIAIQMPMMTGDEISRLEALIESKEGLIRKAIGAESLMVGEKDGKLDFAWFRPIPHLKRYESTWISSQPFAARLKRASGSQQRTNQQKMRSTHSAVSSSASVSSVTVIKHHGRFCFKTSMAIQHGGT